MYTVKCFQNLILLYFSTIYMSMVSDNNQDSLLVTEVLPNCEFQLIDLGRLDESDFENTEGCFDGKNDYRYELVDVHQLNEEFESLMELIDKVESGNDNINMQSYNRIIDKEEIIVSSPNSKNIFHDEYYRFSNHLCRLMFTNYKFGTHSFIKFINTLFSQTKNSKKLNLFLKKQINSMTQFAMLPLIFTKDEFVTKKSISYKKKDNEDETDLYFNLKELFFNMQYVTKYDFSVINLRKFTKLRNGVVTAFELKLTQFITNSFNSFSCVYNKGNLKMINIYADRINYNNGGKKIPKMILVSFIMTKINTIADSVDIILLYKCLFDILTNLHKENVVTCLIKLLIHLVIYYSKENYRRIQLNASYHSDRSKFLLHCCNLTFCKNFTYIYTTLHIEIQQLFSLYYIKGLTIEKVRRLLEIQAFLFNFLTEKDSRDYCYTTFSASNFYDDRNEPLILLASANIQTVIKILEDNKIIN